MSKWLYVDLSDGFYRFPDTSLYVDEIVRGQYLYCSEGNWYWSTNSATVMYLGDVLEKQAEIPPYFRQAVYEACLNS